MGMMLGMGTMFHQFQNTTYQSSHQVQNLLQQMQQMEQHNANQLRQLSHQLEQISSHESMATRQINQLQQICNQLIQENQPKPTIWAKFSITNKGATGLQSLLCLLKLKGAGI
jgi:tRNA C32,U32 (ribose-2'-O)-methylase TrmJ